MNKRLLILLLILTLSLAWMVGNKLWTLKTGEIVELKAEPVDPRSLFRGDYVIITTAIHRINQEDVGGDREFHKNDAIFTLIEEQPDNSWKVLSIHHDNPRKEQPLEKQQIVIKGSVTRISGSTYHTSYGIENYFIPENSGKEIEQAIGKHAISVRIAVDSTGSAAIHSLLKDGNTLSEEGLF